MCTLVYTECEPHTNAVNSFHPCVNDRKQGVHTQNKTYQRRKSSTLTLYTSHSVDDTYTCVTLSLCRSHCVGTANVRLVYAGGGHEGCGYR